jgi:hypothetical protein
MRSPAPTPTPPAGKISAVTGAEDAELARRAAEAIERRGHLRGNLVDLNTPGGVDRSPLCVIAAFYYAATGSFDGWGHPAAERAIDRFAANVGAADRDALCAWNDARTQDEAIEALRGFGRPPSPTLAQ